MKIVLLTHHFPPRFRAGGEQYAYRLTHGLHRRGFTVEVVTIESITKGETYPTCQTDHNEGFPVHRLFYRLPDGAANQFEWSFRNPQLGKWIKTYLEQTRPDIVHVNSGYLLGGTVPEAAFALGIPTVLTLHDYWYICPQITLRQRNGRLCSEPVPETACTWCVLSAKRRYRRPDQWAKGQLMDAFVRLNQLNENMPRLTGTNVLQTQIHERRKYLQQVFAQFDLVISPSRFLLEKMATYGLSTRQVVHIPIGLDDNHLESPRETSLPTTYALRLGYLGQIVPHKGVHLLVKAFQRLNKRPGTCQLILNGMLSTDDSYQRKILHQVNNDPDIVLAGSYPNNEVGQILQQLDVVVVPSTWYENYPVVIVEALATKTPVIAARLGGMAELITHEKNGLLFAVDDVTDLTLQLQRLLDDPHLLNHLRSGIEPTPQLDDELTKLIAHYTEIQGLRGGERVIP